ncbi:MAG: hypothetical protein KGY99_11550, partial [Phycisphaerae bacterium]|nr:hypothetical protein [Phycisphaerae bacterium]
AGAAGIDPRELTLRELLDAADGRSRHDWQQTASVLAMLANCHRDPKKSKPFQPDDFNPHAPRQRGPAIRVTKENITDMRAEFIGETPSTED